MDERLVLALFSAFFALVYWIALVAILSAVFGPFGFLFGILAWACSGGRKAK